MTYVEQLERVVEGYLGLMLKLIDKVNNLEEEHEQLKILFTQDAEVCNVGLHNIE